MQETPRTNLPDQPRPSLERLCELASREQDPDKLLKLVQEINRVVEENSQRSAKAAG